MTIYTETCIECENKCDHSDLYCGHFMCIKKDNLEANLTKLMLDFAVSKKAQLREAAEIIDRVIKSGSFKEMESVFNLIIN